MLTVRTSENTVITSFRLISERQDFSSVRTGENTVRARARIQAEHDDSEESNNVTLEDQEQRYPAVDATDNESEEMELTGEETLRGGMEEKQSSQ